jgi:hypothetical protein
MVTIEEVDPPIQTQRSVGELSAQIPVSAGSGPLGI